ncbi:MAG: hypothetical protein AAGC81_13300 [Pseudomonadota bacterium]
MSRSFLSFAVVSGLGWLLDVGSTTTLVAFGFTPFSGSFVGAGLAVTFVYVISRLSVFAMQRLGTVLEYGLYVLWQVLAISAASALVAVLAYLLEPILGALLGLEGESAATSRSLALATGIGKVLVTPITLTANYFFMKWLTDRAHRQQTAIAREQRL